jgi:MutS domain V
VPGETLQNAAADKGIEEHQAVNSAAQEYSRRLALHQAMSRKLHQRHIWMGNARVVIFLAIVVLCWTIGKSGKPSPFWLVLAVLAFIGLTVLHRRFLRAKSIAERAIALYQRGLERIEDRWTGNGDTGEQFTNPDHLYADDLDIFGQGSLFQLLCTARSHMGKQRLANWLLTQAPATEIHDRQLAIDELRNHLTFREDAALAGDVDIIKADPEKLKRWAEMQREFNSRLWAALGVALSALSLASLGYALVGLVRRGDGFWTPFLLTLVLNTLVLYVIRHPLERVFLGLDHACADLGSLAALLKKIADTEFTSPGLQFLRNRLVTGGETAFEAIAGLNTLCDLEESRHNMYVRALEFPLLYSLHLALALQRWRRRYAASIPVWLDITGEFEALIALATYAYEHPHDPFADLSSAGERPCLNAEALGHPLLPEKNCVANDVSVGGERQVLLVSGSNMSGKSTLLRAVGVNAVLAMMGAPVRARNFSISPVAIGASMRISDSLQKGVSHFYAEITRIRNVVELSRSGPLLFLFDEVLQGTNSQDRKIGAQGILHTLLENGAIGLVTTHDLALTALEEQFPHRVANVHFQEKFENGRLSFDYRLREGVVTTSNGVELMKSIGLQI